MKLGDVLKLSCAIGAIGAAAPAVAQDTAASATTGIGDVVVTAQKRATNLQDTPIAITAVSQDTLTRQGVKQLSDLTRVAPEISIGAVASVQMLTIRGLRTGQFAPTVDAPNAVHLDGNYISRFFGLNGFFFDLERVEVLAGPQGTLYGRNSVGGTMNIITHKPDLDKFGGGASIDIGNYNTQILQGALNLPIADNLAVRVSGMSNKRDGYFTDTNTSDQDLEGYRALVKYAPTERDTIVISGDYEREASRGVPVGLWPITQVFVQPAISQNNTTGTVSLISNPNGFRAGTVSCTAGNTCSTVPILATDDIWHNRNVDGGDYQSTDISSDGFGFQWDHDLDFATLTAQGSWRSMDQTDNTGTIAGAAQDSRLKAATAGPFSPGITHGFISQSNWNSQELRITSNDQAQTTLRYTAGVNHFYEKTPNNLGPLYSYASWYANNTAAQPGTSIGSLVIPYDTSGNMIPNTTSATSSSLWTNAFAVFGEATYTPEAWDALHVTLGARYNWEEKRGIGGTYTRSSTTAPANYAPYNGLRCSIPSSLPTTACPIIFQQYTMFNEERGFERATYKANVAYDLTDDLLAYATYSTGFVSGGFASGVPQSVPFTACEGSLDRSYYATRPQCEGAHSYDAMNVVAKEVGLKSLLFGKRLQTNVALFHYDFENYLTNQSISRPDPTVPNTKIATSVAAANAANTETEGATVDLTALITERDSFHVGAQYVEANIKFNVSDLFYNSMRAYLQANGLNSSDACVNRALVGTADGAATPTSSAALCSDLEAFLTTSGQAPLIPTDQPATYPGSSFPNDFNPEGSLERPKWTINADYSHTFTLPNAELDAQIAYHYVSKQGQVNGPVVAPFNSNPTIPAGFERVTELTRTPAKDTWDMSFRYQRQDAGWSVTAYVRNVLDSENIALRTLTSSTRGLTSFNPTTGQGADATGTAQNLSYAYYKTLYDPPRTFGMQFQANF